VDNRELVGGWIKTFGEMVKTPLALQEDGVCGISYGQGRVCAIEVPADDGPIVIHAPLLALAGRSRESVYAKALALNLYGAGTAGCTIALDERNDQLVLCVSRSAASLDSTSFAALVGGVITNAVRLAGELAEVPAQAPEAYKPIDMMATMSMRV
jgi:hypothetical protein